MTNPHAEDPTRLGPYGWPSEKFTGSRYELDDLFKAINFHKYHYHLDPTYYPWCKDCAENA